MIAAVGSKKFNQILKLIAAEIAKVSRVACSAAWVDSFTHDGQNLPTLNGDHRAHAVRLQLSRAEIRVGQDGTPTRRLTPPTAVELEDFLDGLSIGRAEFYLSPDSSPTAMQLRRIAGHRMQVRWQLTRLAKEDRY